MLRGALEARRAHVGRARRRLANAERAIWKSALRSKFRAGGRRGRGSELPEITARERDEANGEAAANNAHHRSFVDSFVVGPEESRTVSPPGCLMVIYVPE
jgi:hypothetical protein